MITQEEIERDYYSTIEAAKVLNISDARIRRLCLDGKFEGALKTGKSWLIPKITIKNFERLPRGRPKPRNKYGKDVLIRTIKELKQQMEGVSHDK